MPQQRVSISSPMKRMILPVIDHSAGFASHSDLTANGSATFKDAVGNVASSTAAVTVPHDQSQ